MEHIVNEHRDHPKPKNEGEANKQRPKNSTVPNYSEKYKDLMAKAALIVKPSPQEKPQIPEHKFEQEHQKHKASCPSHFFYRVKSIGVGAHSFVYLVQEEDCKMLLAEKSVTRQHALEIKQDLIREIKLLSFLQHPNIIKLYHFYHTETHINLVLQFAEDSLFALKQKFDRFKEKEVIQVTRQLLQALKHIHSHNIVHADIKLQNIMIANGTIKLCDFGLAHTTKKHAQTHSPPKDVDGTLEYLPPQYVQGTDSGAARDIWAVGILAFEMITGKHPFDGLKQNEKWSKLINTHPSKYIQELEEVQKALGYQCSKVKDLVKGIFVPWEKRQTAQKILKLPFYSSHPTPQDH